MGGPSEQHCGLLSSLSFPPCRLRLLLDETQILPLCSTTVYDAVPYVNCDSSPWAATVQLNCPPSCKSNPIRLLMTPSPINSPTLKRRFFFHFPSPSRRQRTTHTSPVSQPASPMQATSKQILREAEHSNPSLSRYHLKPPQRLSRPARTMIQRMVSQASRP